MMRQALVAIAFTVAAVAAGVIDRVAVVVGTQVITESEVLLEVRLTEFFNGQPLDLGADQRKAAAERLVDQQLIRAEMQIGGYPMPAESEGEAALRKFQQENYQGIPAFRAALENHGLTEDEVKRHLLWQAAAMRFTDLRFHMTMAAPAAAQADQSQSADRGSSVAPSPSADRSQSADRSVDTTVEDQMEVWLKEARSNTRIQFKKGAFQ
jgi:hypothetical protein